MTKLTQYSEAFWGPDFVSTAGYDALSKHNSEQKKFLQDFEKYLRKRSEMEMEYSKSLGGLARSLRDRPGIGVMEAAWNTLRGELDSCRVAHEEASSFFSQHAEETKRFQRDITSKRDALEERVKKTQNQKASQFNKVSSMAKTYRQKCQLKEQAKDQYDVLRREVTSTVKDLDKARTRKDKAHEEADRADAVYQNGVVTLEDSRQEWEKVMEGACKEFQESDEQQIEFLRSEMWMAVNRVSQTAVDVDESCERIRVILETCEIDTDISNFIAVNSTGTERPSPVLYQNYYDQGTGGGGGGGGSGNSTPRGGSSSSQENQYPNHQQQQQQQQQRSPLPLPNMGNHASSPSSFYTLATNDDLDPTYASADPTYSVAEPFPDYETRQLTISKAFQTGDNFSVQVGETVTLMRKVNNKVVEVKTQNNKQGMIPLACIREAI